MTEAQQEQEKFLRHNCNPRNPGKPLPWGRKAPEGECPRCDELRAGAAPRDAHPAIQAVKRKRDQEERTIAEIRAHDCATSGCFRDGLGNFMCTAFQW